MIRLLLVALVALTLTHAPAAAQETAQPTGTIGVEDSAERDAAIATRIRDILTELDGYEDVTVTVSSGIVTFRGTTLDAETANRLNDLSGRVEGVVAIRNEVSETTDVVRRLNPAWQRFEKRMSDLVAWSPLLLIAFSAFLVVVFLGVLLARFRQPWERLAPNAFIADIYRQLIRLAFVVAGIVVGLDILNATALLSTILGAAGIIGLAIGFAVKDTVENFIASVMLSIRQPFRPNDAVEINGDEGKVIRLTSRATILLSWDGNQIRIPNSTVFKSRIVNYSMNAERRFLFDIGIAPDADAALAVKVAQDTLAALPFTLKTPASDAWIDGIGDSTVTLRLIGWIDQRETSLLAARGEAIRLSLAALTEAGIDMPEPTYRLIGAGGEGFTDTPDRAAPTRGTETAQPAPRPAQAEALDVQAHAEHELEAIVDEERRDKNNEDLLTSDAPTE
ncbi:mechanosensitive ion channel family protein [Pseudooceanicola atlanticus]|uniref:Small-conductance mechanosensitive channel n=1 Tax=Pseudooceanicola atlanticus TaxID=1461694 RepID=A0A0A0EBQ1_9RHOB|nr:mechanosensitive ion channel family protein [Pseudooceanicola atlanticus]KGM47548.1 mechanosensitive ion channel protein MscS [Pseudooceanicola atlanticus]